MSESWLLDRWTSIIDGFNLSKTSKSVGLLYVCVKPDDTASVDASPTSPPLRSSGLHCGTRRRVALTPIQFQNMARRRFHHCRYSIVRDFRAPCLQRSPLVSTGELRCTPDSSGDREFHFPGQSILYQRGDVSKKREACSYKQCWAELASRTTWRITKKHSLEGCVSFVYPFERERAKRSEYKDVFHSCIQRERVKEVGTHKDVFHLRIHLKGKG